MKIKISSTSTFPQTNPFEDCEDSFLYHIISAVPLLILLADFISFMAGPAEVDSAIFA